MPHHAKKPTVWWRRGLGCGGAVGAAAAACAAVAFAMATDATMARLHSHALGQAPFVTEG